MAWTLGDAVQQIRQRHPAYDRDRVPTTFLAAQATRLQRQLIQDGARWAPEWITAQASIFLAFSSSNQPGTVGAGSTGGLPVNGDGDLVETSAGQVVAYDLDTAVEIVPPFVVDAGTDADTIVDLTAGRTVNADIGLYIHIIDGPGSGPDAIREITANTATTWTLDAPLTNAPVVGQSLARVIVLPPATPTPSVVTALPPLTEHVGYLVRLDASGQPYVDTTRPLVAHRETDIPLPPHLLLLGATVRGPVTGTFSGPMRGAAVRIIPWAHRFDVRGGWPAITVQNQSASIVGDVAWWQGVDSLELRYVPIAPAFATQSRTVLDTPMLLPDWCENVMVAGLAVEAARRCAALKVDGVDPAAESAEYRGYWDQMRRTLAQQSDRRANSTARIR